MPGTTYKLLGPELSISSAAVVRSTYEANGSLLIRIFNNSASSGVLTLANSGGTYANLTVGSYQEVVIKKQQTDTVQGTNMLAVPIAYQY